MSKSDSSLPTLTSGRGGSPFETLRRIDEYGRGYWSARDLQPLLEYDKWENFLRTIERAMRAADSHPERAYRRIRHSDSSTEVSGRLRGRKH